MSLARARLAESLARERSGDAPDALFTVGLLSLLDVMLQVPLTQALGPLRLTVPARQALIERGGPWRDILALAEALEAFLEDPLVTPILPEPPSVSPRRRVSRRGLLAGVAVAAVLAATMPSLLAFNVSPSPTFWNQALALGEGLAGVRLSLHPSTRLLRSAHAAFGERFADPSAAVADFVLDRKSVV